MSDQAYHQRGAKRARAWWVILGALFGLGYVYIVVVGVFRDDCTNSLNRSPSEVIGAYSQVVSRGEILDAQACWQSEAYFDLEAGVQRCALVCAVSGETHQGEIILESVGLNLPWRHWKIVQSSVGGTVTDPWCSEE